MTQPDHNHEQEPAPGATFEQRLWAGISFALAIASLFGVMYLDRVHGSAQWQATFIVAFVCYFFAAMIIGTQPDMFVEPDDDEDKHADKPGGEHS